jgi:hypothetical protein
MTLNASGPISIAGTTAGQSIQIELGGNGTTQMGLNCASVRTLAGVPTGAIVMPTNFYGKSNTPPFGCATYGTPGTYSFTVPSGITQISVVCVGAGGGGGSADPCGSWYGNGGGALSYTNCIPVTPGETLTVVAGAGGPAAFPNGLAGGPSSVSRGPTTLIRAVGAPQGTGSDVARNPGAPAASGTGSVRFSGGSGGNGGGGAAGYAGDGGEGGGFSNVLATAGSGGGGGGGGGAVQSASNSNTSGAGGGGVGLVVQGANGAAGTNNNNVAVRTGGGGGSGGSAGTDTNTGANQPGRPGGAFGGGGGGGGENNGAGGTGGNGGVRIIYGGTGKSYPNNSAP